MEFTELIGSPRLLGSFFSFSRSKIVLAKLCQKNGLPSRSLLSAGTKVKSSPPSFHYGVAASAFPLTRNDLQLACQP
jgi:hypothetical protein